MLLSEERLGDSPRGKDLGGIAASAPFSVFPAQTFLVVSSCHAKESLVSASRPWASLLWSHPEVGPERTNLSSGTGPLYLRPYCLALGIRTVRLVVPNLGLSPENELVQYEQQDGSWCFRARET